MWKQLEGHAYEDLQNSVEYTVFNQIRDNYGNKLYIWKDKG